MQLRECIQAEDIKMYKFHFFVLFFCDGSSQWGGGMPPPGRRGQSSSRIALRCLPTSVPDGHLVGMLKFNADES